MNRYRFVVVLLTLLLLAACGGSGGAEPVAQVVQVEGENAEVEVTGEVVAAEAETTIEVAEPDVLPMVDPLGVSGDIVTAGSSTVFPLAERMADRFQDEG